jgi:hypothetical protein
VLQSLRDYADQLRAAQVRIADMLEHALDEDEIAGLGAALAEPRNSAQASYMRLQQPEGLMGWALQVR